MADTRPSAEARAGALAMRRFDPGLTDAQLAQIARSIDRQRGLGATLAPTRKPLANAVEPITAPRHEPAE
jgi:hypothetical protein